MGRTSDPSGTLLGLSWASLGPLLGASWPLLAALGSLLGALGGRWTRQKTEKKRILASLRASWLLLALSWPHLGASRAHLEASGAVFWSLHGLAREIPTHVPGRVVTTGFQERGWESLLAFRLDWLGIGHASSWQQSPGTPLGAAVSAKRFQ